MPGDCPHGVMTAQKDQNGTLRLPSNSVELMLQTVDAEMQPGIRSALANTIQDRGNVAEQQERWDDALADFDRILELPLWPKDDNWEEEVPEHQHAYGLLQRKRGEALQGTGANAEACEALTMAIAVHEALRERLGDAWPRAWDDILRRNYEVRRDVYAQLGQDAEAVGDGVMALAIGRVELWSGDAWTARRRDLLVRASMLEADGRYAEAIPLREAHREDCGEAWPLAFRTELARAYIDYGYQLGEADDAERAAQQYQKAVQLGLDVREDDGFSQSGLPTAIVRACFFRANLFANGGNAEGETAELDVACDVIAEVLAAPESDWLMSHGTYAIALRRRGVLHMMAQECAQGLERFRAAVDLRERAAREITAMGEEDARFVKQGLSPESLMAEYNDCARASGALEDRDASLAAYSAAIAIGEELGSSLTLPFTEELGMAYLGRAVLHRGAGRVNEALGDCDRALAVWGDLETQLDGNVPEGTAQDIAITRQLREELLAQS